MLYLGIVLDSSPFDRISVSITSWTANCYTARTRGVRLHLPVIRCVIRFCRFKARSYDKGRSKMACKRIRKVKKMAHICSPRLTVRPRRNTMEMRLLIFQKRQTHSHSHTHTHKPGRSCTDGQTMSLWISLPTAD